jgi:transposase
MPQPSRKTPQRIKRMLELQSGGASSREIAEALKVTHPTILEWLEDAGLKANGGQGSRTKRKRSPPDAAAAKMLEKQKALAEMEIPDPSKDLASMLADLHEQLAEAYAFVRYHREATKSGTSNMGDYDKAMIIAERLATRIAELTPSAPVDPANDPSNVDAAAQLRRKFGRLIEKAEADFVCQSCGGDPYGRGRH